MSCVFFRIASRVQIFSTKCALKNESKLKETWWEKKSEFVWALHKTGRISIGKNNAIYIQ